MPDVHGAPNAAQQQRPNHAARCNHGGKVLGCRRGAGRGGGRGCAGSGAATARASRGGEHAHNIIACISHVHIPSAPAPRNAKGKIK